MMLTITILALIAYTLAAPAKPENHDSDIKIIKLDKIESVREKMIKSGDLNAFNSHVNKQKALKAMNQKFDEKSLNLEAYMDAAYTWNIGVGTPSQPFKALFDISNPWLWIPDKTCVTHPVNHGECEAFCQGITNENLQKVYCDFHQCSGCSYCPAGAAGNSEIQVPPSGCENKNHFDKTRSQSYGDVMSGQDRFDESLNEVDKVQGFVGYDVVELFGIQSHQYIELADTVGNFWGQVDADGVMGFGHPQTEKISGLYIQPWLLNAYQQHHIRSDTFSVYMNAQAGNAISIGGANPKWYEGKVHYHNVPKNSQYWTLNVQKFWLGDNDFVPAGRAMLSTTANYIGAPKTVVEKVAASVGTLGFDQQMEMFQVLCYFPLKDISLFIDGTIYVLNYQDYVIHASDGKCYLGFKEISGQPEPYVLGSPFFNAYYAIFEFQSRHNKPRIGLAKSRSAAQ